MTRACVPQFKVAACLLHNHKYNYKYKYKYTNTHACEPQNSRHTFAAQLHGTLHKFLNAQHQPKTFDTNALMYVYCVLIYTAQYCAELHSLYTKILNMDK